MDQIPPSGEILRPSVADIPSRTDVYFNRTKTIVARFGDKQVTYAVFLRRPVISAPRLTLDWLRGVAAERGLALDITLTHEEGTWVGAGEPLIYITGSFVGLTDLETILLQKLGAPCVAAHNAYQMCLTLPKAAFIAMEARHCAGSEMEEMMAYAASVGGAAARREGAIGFIGNANDATAGYFGRAAGLGTMPHALIGYAGSTVRAAEMFHETFPAENLTVLVDYFGREITDALAVCRRFPALAAAGKLAFRLDTHGGRFIETLDPQVSYAVLEQHAPGAIRRYRSETELRFLVGTGVSAAGIWAVRDALDEAGFPAVKITVSSGFNADKCRVMADAKAPIDNVGTGSFIPDAWSETYATADIVSYDGQPMVKVGREFLLKQVKG
jgi:nicotinate phosphoribosyltransferase